MAAVGHDAQPRAEPARVLEGIVQGQLRIARAPEDEDGAGDVLEIGARVVGDHRLPGCARVEMEPLALQEADRGALGDRRGIRYEPGAEERATVPLAARVAVAKRRDP